jgi:hypothetical protein
VLCSRSLLTLAWSAHASFDTNASTLHVSLVSKWDATPKTFQRPPAAVAVAVAGGGGGALPPPLMPRRARANPRPKWPGSCTSERAPK